MEVDGNKSLYLALLSELELRVRYLLEQKWVDSLTCSPMGTQGFRETFKQTVFEHKWLVAADVRRCAASGCYNPPSRRR